LRKYSPYIINEKERTMKSDKDILSKFKGKKGAFIESDEERRVLEKWALGGLVTFGFNSDLKPEAKLTKKGLFLLPVIDC